MIKKSGYETSWAGSASQSENLAHLVLYPEMIEKSRYETSRAGSASQSENLAHLFFYPEMIEKVDMKPAGQVVLVKVKTSPTWSSILR